MSITAVLSGFGVEASLLGSEPRSESEYGERVRILAGQPPSWREVEPRLIEAAREAAAAAIDGAAHGAIEALRPAGTMRALLDALKAAEARAALAAGTPDAASFPLLAASAGSHETQAVVEEAMSVVAMADAWLREAARIEGQRIAAKKKLAAAAGFEQLDRARRLGLEAVR